MLLIHLLMHLMLLQGEGAMRPLAAERDAATAAPDHAAAEHDASTAELDEVAAALAALAQVAGCVDAAKSGLGSLADKCRCVAAVIFSV